MPSARLRVGVIGASPSGSWGSQAHIPVLKALAQFELKAVCNARLESAREAAQRFGAELAFDDARALADHPHVDVVAVCVRVPRHFELVKAAIEAGKPVYCEWPLARHTAEAEAMAEMARRARVAHMAGLQARHAPALSYLGDLLREGAIGEAHATTLVHSRSWFVSASGMEYLQDVASGAHFLAVPGGHAVDAVCTLMGEFTSLQATLARVDRGANLTGTSANQIVLSGALSGGAVACIRLQGAPGHGTGLWWEINGTRGDLAVTAPDRGLQMGELTIRRTTAPGRFEELPIPERYFGVPDTLRAAPLLNVAKAWLEFHAAIESGRRPRPDFFDALARHRTLDMVNAAAETGTRMYFAEHEHE